jgi:drug/metabolite transporter (DMT)-like permease
MTQTQTPAFSSAAPEDFFQLLKPRVMSLVIFTAATGLIVAGSDINPLVAAIAIQLFRGQTDLAPLEYTALIWSAALGWILFAEVPRPQALAGGLIIAAACIGLAWTQQRAARRPASAL